MCILHIKRSHKRGPYTQQSNNIRYTQYSVKAHIKFTYTEYLANFAKLNASFNLIKLINFGFACAIRIHCSRRPHWFT